MSRLQYIRDSYGVPAYRGRRVRYTGRGKERPMDGTILCASGPYLSVRFDGQKESSRLHPTWEVEYLAVTQ